MRDSTGTGMQHTSQQDASEKETLYTRGGVNDKDDRGVSMVERHRSKLQQAREEVAMGKLRPVVPGILSNSILLEALRKYDYNVDNTIHILRHFMEEEKSELKDLHKKKEERKSELLEENGISLRQMDSPSTSSRDDDSTDKDDWSREGRKRRHGRRSKHAEKKKKKKKRSSRRRDDFSTSGSESEPSGDEDHARKRERRKSRDGRTRRRYEEDRRRGKKEKHSKRDSGRNRKHASQDRYGKYGVIRETDIYAKRPEFMLWAMEEKHKDVENLSRFEEKELFKAFMDEYNLATLPHRKYYDLEKYEASKRGKERRIATTERMVFDDEAERRVEIEEQRLKEKDERLQQAYNELQSSSKAQDMREQELLRAKMDLAYRTGDQKEAERLAERLKPDDVW